MEKGFRGRSKNKGGNESRFSPKVVALKKRCVSGVSPLPPPNSTLSTPQIEGSECSKKGSLERELRLVQKTPPVRSYFPVLIYRTGDGVPLFRSSVCRIPSRYIRKSRRQDNDEHRHAPDNPTDLALKRTPNVKFDPRYDAYV